jgi:hypothetical protein
MADPYPVQPPLEAVVIAALKAETDLDATFGDRIATKLDEDRGYPFLTAHASTGGTRPDERWLAARTVEFAVWGEHGSEPALEVAANLAESVVLGLSGFYASPGVDAYITGVEPVLGPRNVADPATGRPRYIFEARVFVHPAG